MTRTFKLYRDKDVSGVSGTGLICEGVLFSDGHSAVHWLGQWPLTTAHPEGLSSVFAIHDHGGRGDLRLVWDDGAENQTTDFDEKDIQWLHEILSMGDAFRDLGARRLIRKIRQAMILQVPQVNPVKD